MRLALILSFLLISMSQAQADSDRQRNLSLLCEGGNPSMYASVKIEAKINFAHGHQLTSAKVHTDIFQQESQTQSFDMNLSGLTNSDSDQNDRIWLTNGDRSSEAHLIVNKNKVSTFQIDKDGFEFSLYCHEVI